MLGPAHIEAGHVLHPARDVVDRDDVLQAVLTQASQEDLLRAGNGDATSLAKRSKIGEDDNERRTVILSWVPQLEGILHHSLRLDNLRGELALGASY